MSTSAAIPPRFWWLKRLTAAGIVFLFLLLALRIWWGWIAQRRIDAVIAQAKARGEPISAEDFLDVQIPGPPNQNAVVALKASVASVFYNPAQQAFESQFVFRPPISTADQQMLHGIVTANAKAITLARSAADLPAADWGVRLTNPINNVTVPRFIGQTQLARLMRDAAIDHHLHTDDAQAVKDIRAILRQADLLDAAGPFLIAHLCSAAVQGIAADTIQQIAGELQVGGDGASVQEVRDLIRSLLNDQKYSFMAAQGWYEERLYTFEILKQQPLPFLNWSGSAAFWIFKPMWELQEVYLFQNFTAIAHALQEPNLPAAKAKLPVISINNNDSPLYLTSHYYLMFLMPTFGGPVGSHFRTLTERRAAAVLLALRLYELDHGTPPQNLDQLVPDYLPAVPLDPLSSDIHVLRYIATPGKEAVYSVGFDGKDDGGSTQWLVVPSSGQSPSPWNMRDAVFLLHPPPTTAPVH